MARSKLALGVLVVCLAFLAAADTKEVAAESGGKQKCQVTLLDEATWNADAPQTFIITHGLGGLRADDRFAKLACTIQEKFPNANVVRIDWSKSADVRAFGLLMPWKVAANIDPVAKAAAVQLRERKVAADRVTLIGESFGNYVNFRIAKALGGVQLLLAFNPANELGGYVPPDLRTCARASCSFHTYSPYDSAAELAHSDLFLETPANSDHFVQHTYGVVWLTAQLQQGDRTWIALERQLPPRKQGSYCGQVTLNGDVLDAVIARTPPQPELQPEPLKLAEETPHPEFPPAMLPPALATR